MIPILLFLADAGSGCKVTTNSFFFLPTWYAYLPTQADPLGKCVPFIHFPGGIWLIGLALLEILLRLAGFVAVISIIYAGIEYMTTQGNAEKGVAARKRVVNTIIGLAIVIIAAELVSYAGNHLGGS
jgi:hypothetical protein